MVLAGQEFEDTVEQGRVLPDIRVLAGVVHVAGAVEELADVKAREGTDDKADFGEDAETAADAIGNVEDGPADSWPSRGARFLFRRRRGGP